MVAGRLTRWLIGLNCLAVATVILCCTASIKPQKITEEEILTKRATEYWAYKIKGDLDKCYGYEVPSYREKVNVVDYIRSQGQILRWTEAEVRGVEMYGGDRARVEAQTDCLMSHRLSALQHIGSPPSSVRTLCDGAAAPPFSYSSRPGLWLPAP